MKKGLFLIFIILFSISCKDEINVITSKQPGKIVGTVLPKDSVATVQLIQGEIIAKAMTINGIFQFEDVKPGIYRITVKADNLGKQEIQNIKVEDGEGNDIGIIQLLKYPFPLLSTSPFDGEENVLAFSRSIRLEFSEEIDPSSLERGFKIEPNTEMGNFSNSSNKYFYFYPDLNFETEYKVTLDTSVTTTFGEHLEFPATFKFKTDNFKLTEFNSPTFSTSSNNLSLYFNGELAENFENFISVEPSIPVSMRLYSSSRGRGNYGMGIYPINGWKAESTFKITLSENLEEINGALLKEDTTLTFTTPELKIVETVPLDGQYFVDTISYIRIMPNYLLNQGTIEDAISITPNINFEINIRIGSGRTLFYIYPTESFSPNTHYTVTIDNSLTDFYGVPLKEAYSFSFTTR